MDKHTSFPQPAGRLASLAAVAALAAVAWLAPGPALAPPAGVNAPAQAFSATRALPHIAALTRAPRPVASPANAGARTYLLAQLRALGLDPQVQSAVAQHNETDQLANVHVTLARVHNIVARLPGSAADHAARPALLLATHYDSSATSLGAAQGAAGPAALLETLRALRASAPLPYDVIVLLADAQQQYGLGAQAFVRAHPWAGQVGLTLKFDNAGNRGPLVLYDSSGDDGAAIEGWARHAPQARGSSLMRAVYPHMPHAVPMGPLRELGAPLLQFASVEGYTGPQGSADTPARLDLRMLQHEGDTMLALTRHFASAPLTRAPAGQVHFALPFVGIVHYSAGAVWPFTRVCCLLLFGVTCLAIRRHRIEAAAIVKGSFGYLLIAAATAAGAWVAWQTLGARTGYAPLWQSSSEREYWYQLAIAALCSGAFMLLQRRLQRGIGTPAAAAGAFVALAAVLLTLSSQLPGASFILLWPMLASLSAQGLLYLGGPRLPLLLAGALPAVLLITPAVRDSFAVMSVARMNLPLMLLAALLGGALMLLAAVARRYLVRALLLAGLACIGVAGSARPFSAPLPAPNQLVYYKDMPTWRSYWLLPAAPLDAWTRQVFAGAAAPHVLTEVFGHYSSPLWYAEAPRSTLAFPYIEVLKDEDSPRRRVEFTLRSKNRAPNIEMWIERGKPVRTVLDGRVLTDEKSRNWALSLYGMDSATLRFAIDMEGGSENFLVRVQEKLPGLPDVGLGARPPALQPALTPMTATTIASDTLLFR